MLQYGLLVVLLFCGILCIAEMTAYGHFHFTALIRVSNSRRRSNRRLTQGVNEPLSQLRLGTYLICCLALSSNAEALSTKNYFALNPGQTCTYVATGNMRDNSLGGFVINKKIEGLITLRVVGPSDTVNGVETTAVVENLSINIEDGSDIVATILHYYDRNKVGAHVVRDTLDAFEPSRTNFFSASNKIEVRVAHEILGLYPVTEGITKTLHTLDPPWTILPENVEDGQSDTQTITQSQDTDSASSVQYTASITSNISIVPNVEHRNRQFSNVIRVSQTERIDEINQTTLRGAEFATEIGTYLTFEKTVSHQDGNETSLRASLLNCTGTDPTPTVTPTPSPTPTPTPTNDQAENKNAGKPDDYCSTPNPINQANGNKFAIETDYRGADTFPLEFTRFYNSTAGADGDSLGRRWRHTYERRIEFNDDNIAMVIRPDGKQLRFHRDENGWTSDPDVNHRLSVTTDSNNTILAWILTTAPDDEIENYDAKGRLLSIANRAGVTHELDYNDEGRLSDVTHSLSGRKLNFSYDESGQLSSLTDPAGRLYQYTQSNGKLISVTYPDTDSLTPKRSYVYENANFPHALTGIIDENNQRYATYEYDDQGRAILSVHAGDAQKTQLNYGSEDGHITVTDPLGTEREYQFKRIDGTWHNLGLSQACSSCGTEQSQSFDEHGFLTERTDFNGNSSRFSYDLSRHLQTTRTEAVGTSEERTINTAWHPSFRLPITISEPTQETTLDYDEEGNLLRRRISDRSNAELTRSYTYTYNDHGQVTSFDGPRTDIEDTTRYSYDEKGQLSQITNALGHVTTISERDADGRATRIEYPQGLVVQLSYDPRGRLVSRSAGNETLQIAYDSVGQPIKLTQPDNSFLSLHYDAAQRLIEIGDSVGNSLHFSLDGMGNRIKEEIRDPEGTLSQSRARTYDALNRVIQELGAEGQTTIHQYDPNGNRTATTDPLGHSTMYSYDSLNRVSRLLDPAEGSQQSSYDDQDRLTQFTDPRELSTQYRYDGLGNLVSLNSPDTGATQYEYDNAGNRIRRTDADQRSGRYQYDALNRLTVAEFDPDQTFRYQYDESPTGIGRLTQMIDPSGTTTWRYDEHGRVIEHQQTINDLSLSLHYDYDAGGRLAQLTYPSGKVISFHYDGAGQINAMTHDDQALLSDIAYQPFGAPAQWTWSNGSTQRRTYDTDGRLQSYLLGSETRTLSYDLAGRLIGFNDPNASQSFDYDALDRLTRAASNESTYAYNYDANGNRLSLTTAQGETRYTYGTDNHRLQQTSGAENKTYAYDASGNLLNDGTTDYRYDARGRLRQVSSADHTTDYVLNGLGQRISKRSDALPSGINHYLYDEHGHLLGEYDGNGQALREIVYLQDIPVLVFQGDSTFFIQTDQLNTPRALIATDNRIVWRWDGEPFGRDAANEDPDGDGETITFNLRFPGQFFDAETGLHYNYFRDYDPKIARYAESDPLGLRGGPNTYRYVRGDPTRLTDPTGLIGDNPPPSPLQMFLDLLLHSSPVGQGSDLVPQQYSGSDTYTPINWVIGRMEDLQNLQDSERALADLLNYQGRSREDWKQNCGMLRAVMGERRPIRDASPNNNGGEYLNAERNLLENHGWTFDKNTNYWMPPK